ALTGDEPETTQGSNHVVIPLIVLDHVPLVIAITNLAHHANLRCIIDPQTGLGARNDPEVSIRWSNITARGALLALLENYVLGADCKAGVIRIIKKDAPTDVSARLVQLIRDAAGVSLTNGPPLPSANSVQCFTIFVPSAPVPKPARVIVRAEQVPAAAEVQR